MGRRRALFLKILLFLFALNTISLFFYFFTSHSHHLPSKTSTENHQTENHQTEKNLLNKTKNHFPFHGKPWPILPSFLPWSTNPNLSLRSCEAYFGNGFSRRIDLLRPPEKINPAGKGWFRCFFSETLESSICEGGRIRMDPDRIRMSNGGEDLELVIGRSEEEELPVFEEGAFEIEIGERDFKDGKFVDKDFLDKFVPRGDVSTHTMRGLIDSIRVVRSEEFSCSQWVEDATLLVTRFEYANFFHTVTDWYSAYVASRVTGLPNRPHLVFVDGHCKTQLEETWRAMFSSLRYAKNFTGPVCFRHVILSPLGYETALFKGLTETINCQGAPAHELWENPDNRKTARLSEFGEMLKAAFHLPLNKGRVIKPVSGHNILFVRREDYLAHPRHAGKVESRLSNEQEVYDSLKSWVSNHLECKIKLVNGLFAHMSMKEQIHAIQDASIIIGAHGAGLTHIISARPKTIILEIISSQYRRPHFALIAKWKGLEYNAINLHGSSANPSEVIDMVSSILRTLGC
ncbi:beta-1,2-xylosyltransferase isoform X1 [Tasmannia lanceolata]|uniref:beta-1,2-xylosyltransferase isoform X1 n=1 Tax=Tasmannia lanceolata TaxID=3420 RepID=UPI004063CF25